MALSLAGSGAVPAPSAGFEIRAEDVLVLLDGTLIDGTGSGPVSDAVVMIGSGRIIRRGSRKDVVIPPGAKIIDLGGAFILPGFINAHVHEAYDARRLEAWAEAGVTTVRDEGVLPPLDLKTALALRDKLNRHPARARLISAGMMICPPQGYGRLFVRSPAEAGRAAEAEIALGADQIKVSLEDGYAGASGLPKLSDGELDAIVQAAHRQGRKVSAHVTQAKYMALVVRAGVDDVAHIAYDEMPDDLIQAMVGRGIPLVPTFSVLRAYNALYASVTNLRRFIAAGGIVALGNDYTSGQGGFELGMPWYELSKMAEAGMSPMQIIVASTRNAALVCGRAADLGTIEAGKVADLLMVESSPLTDISNLARIKMLIKGGHIIINRIAAAKDAAGKRISS